MKINTGIIGVCLGASSLSFVKVKKTPEGASEVIGTLTVAHGGSPKSILIEKLREFNPEMLPMVFTGRKFRHLVSATTIPEPQATEYAVAFTSGDRSINAVASLGGETFLIYELDKTLKITNLFSKNQCASGTGEFFLQQIERMNIPLAEAVHLNGYVEPYKVSGRCSVFCKSDCTHALNKGTPKDEVLAGLSLMMAEKVEELLRKIRQGSILLVGGVTQNAPVLRFLKEKLPQAFVPAYATCFEALGAALYGLEHGALPISSYDHIFIEKSSSFVFHEPLELHKHKVIFKDASRAMANPGDECTLGLDVGSTTTKAVVLRNSDNAVLASVYLYTHGNPVEASRKCYKELLDQIPVPIKITGLGTTGSGRHIAALHGLTDGVVNEITAHAAAAVHFDPEVDTIFEIGGQDAKYSYIVNRVPADYAMNEACSAGTGSFIEESAKESLRVGVLDIEKIAMRGTNPPNFSDQCAAFISSDIKTALQENISLEDVVAGLVYSICLNYINRVKGQRPVGKKIFMQGGVCYNRAIPIAMAALTGKEIIVPPDPGLMGAFGVALVVKEKIELNLLAAGDFSLEALSSREVKYHKPFICAGGREHCDLACPINMIEVMGKKYPFGGACSKYYSISAHDSVNIEKYDLVKIRERLLFEKYAPGVALPDDAPSVGINLSFQTFSLYPLYYNFFSGLGARVVLPDRPDEGGLDREYTSFCYPGELSLCMFENLVKKNPDYYFVPNVLELFTDGEKEKRLDFNCTCVFVSGEPYYLAQAFKDIKLGRRLLTPTLNFAIDFESEEDSFVQIARQTGIADEQAARKSYRSAVQMQKDYAAELIRIGTAYIAELEKHPDEFAIVLLGRAYNTFAETANKGIPQKISSRGVAVIPFDMIDYSAEEIDDNQYWEGSKKILKTARLVKNHPQLFAVYVSNFSCGPDSMTLHTFRSIMGTKPALTLELDGHTADAGINTRIDAAIDIIQNYRKISLGIKPKPGNGYTPASIEVGNNEAFFITSDGERVPLSDKRVKILIPSMGDLSARLFAAGVRGQGFNCEALPEGNPTILHYARANASGKECLPILLCAGSLVDYIENRWDGQQYLAFFIIQGAGSCRLGQYPVFLREMIRQKQLRNVGTLVLMNEDGFSGIGPKFAMRGMQAIITADVLDDVRSAIMTLAADPDAAMETFEKEFDELITIAEERPSAFYGALAAMSARLGKIPRHSDIGQAKYIALVGEIYVRRDHFSHKWLNKYFARRGFIVKDAYISEWIYYVDYLLKHDHLEPASSVKGKYERMVRITYMKYAEWRIKKILSRSGFYEFEFTDVAPLIERTKHVVPLEYKGEPTLTLGVVLHETIKKYCGVINLGPFGCMPTRFAEAVTIPEMSIGNKIEIERRFDSNYTLPEYFDRDVNLPFLTIETDGNVFPQLIEARLETFALQAERMADLMKEMRKNGNGKKH